MKFSCEVKTVHGQPDHRLQVDAPNQSVAQDKALAKAKEAGLTPTGRVRAVKVPE
jgi:hypothetical protein